MNSSPGHSMPDSPTYAGQLNPLFLFPDNLTLAESQQMPHALALSDSERHRLVKASKSPTDPETLLNRAVAKCRFLTDQKRLTHNHEHFVNTGECDAPNYQSYEHQPLKTPHGAPGCRAIVEQREWSGEFRLRTEVDGQNLQPPEQAGERISEMLSSRGATKIAESCAYMSAVKGGYKTFVTGTLKPEARERVANGETTIQKEISRTMDALQKMYSRGWTMENGKRVDGIDGGLAYCWVVEIPKNDQGEDNPHVHMLLGWRVPFSQFQDWAARIEGIWGHGYFKLEKIKDSAQAGAYMAKAAGYMCKAQDMDTQGLVKGNRYGISAVARAPGWETYTVAQLHIASQLIVDVYDHLTVTHGDKFRERKRLNNALSAIPKDKKTIRERLGKKLAAVRDELNALPIRCNKYQVIVKGMGNAFRFLSWATNPEHDQGNDWLPEKPPGMAWEPGVKPNAADSLYHSKLRDTIRVKVERRKLWRRLRMPEWLSDIGESLSFWHSVKHDYENDVAINREYESQRDGTFNSFYNYSMG